MHKNKTERIMAVAGGAAAGFLTGVVIAMIRASLYMLGQDRNKTFNEEVSLLKIPVAVVHHSAKTWQVTMNGKHLLLPAACAILGGFLAWYYKSRKQRKTSAA